MLLWRARVQKNRSGTLSPRGDHANRCSQFSSWLRVSSRVHRGSLLPPEARRGTSPFNWLSWGKLSEVRMKRFCLTSAIPHDGFGVQEKFWFWERFLQDKKELL